MALNLTLLLSRIFGFIAPKHSLCCSFMEEIRLLAEAKSALLRLPRTRILFSVLRAKHALQFAWPDRFSKFVGVLAGHLVGFCLVELDKRFVLVLPARALTTGLTLWSAFFLVESICKCCNLSFPIEPRSNGGN